MGTEYKGSSYFIEKAEMERQQLEARNKMMQQVSKEEVGEGGSAQQQLRELLKRRQKPQSR